MGAVRGHVGIIGVGKIALDNDAFRGVHQHLPRHRALDVELDLLAAQQVEGAAPRRAPFAARGVQGTPAVAAVVVESDARVGSKIMGPRGVCCRLLGEWHKASRQADAAHARFQPAPEDLLAPAATFRVCRVDTARGGGDFAVKSRPDLAIVEDGDLRVGVKTAVQFIVMDLHIGIPSIYELGEVGEGQAAHVHLGE